MSPIRLLARPMLASMFVFGGLNALKNAEGHAIAAKKVTDRVVPLAQKAAPGLPVPTEAKTLVKINGAAQVLAGAALATGRFPRVSSGVLAASLVPTTLAGHAFWEESEPEARKMQQIQFLKNVSMLGGLLLAGVDTEGRPGLAWRAGHAATSARKEAGRLARDARREAKLARAQLT